MTMLTGKVLPMHLDTEKQTSGALLASKIVSMHKARSSRFSATSRSRFLVSRCWRQRRLGPCGSFTRQGLRTAAATVSQRTSREADRFRTRPHSRSAHRLRPLQTVFSLLGAWSTLRRPCRTDKRVDRTFWSWLLWRVPKHSRRARLCRCFRAVGVCARSVQPDRMLLPYSA